VRVYHDDSAELKFRSTLSFLKALKDAAEIEYIDELESEFAAQERTENDINNAKHLITLAKTLARVEHTDAVRFAVTLFSTAHLPELKQILDSENSYYREAVITALQNIGTPEAKRLLFEHNNEYKRFVIRCSDQLYSAGLQTTIVDETKIRLDPGPVSLNMQIFFDKRDDPNIIAFLIERAKVFLESAQKRKPGTTRTNPDCSDRRNHTIPCDRPRGLRSIDVGWRSPALSMR